MAYKIVQSQYAIAGGAAGHNLFVLMDDSGKVLKEMDGLATAADGSIKPIGYLPSDQLKFYNFDGSYLYSPDQNQQAVAEGTAQQMLNMWGAAADCGNAMNALNLSYPMFGLGANSNSVASTLAQCMGVQEANLSWAWTPGQGTLLLSADVIQGIQSSHGIGSAPAPAPDPTPEPAPAPDPEPDPGDGGDGGGEGCVATTSVLPDGLLAGDITVGAVMQLADEKTLRPGTGVVSYSQRKSAAGFRITTRSGVTLVCSDTAPIPTPEGLVLAPDLLGKSVPVRIDAEGVSESRWEPVTAVDAVGPITVQHITVGDKCFWAGEKPGAYILHHNLKDADPGGGGGGDEPPIDDNLSVSTQAHTAQMGAASHATTATHPAAQAVTPASLPSHQGGSVHAAPTYTDDATSLIHAMASFSAKSEAGVVLSKHTQLDQVPLASHPSR